MDRNCLIDLFLLLAFSGDTKISKHVMILPAIYVSVTLFLIPSLYGDGDMCKEIFDYDGLDDCNTTHLTNLGSKPESGKCM